GLEPGQLTISRDQVGTSALTVSYSISGGATNGTDYEAISGSVVIPAGSLSAPVNITPKQDSLVEGTEAVTLELTPSAAYALGETIVATVNIADDDFGGSLPVVNITANDPSAAEQGQDPGSFTVTLNQLAASALTVHYSIEGTATNGTDYTTISGSVVVAQGQSTATITIATSEDSLVEGMENVLLRLVSNAAYTLGSSTQAVVTIADNDGGGGGPIVTIGPTGWAAEQGQVAGGFAVLLNQPATTNLTVFYSIAAGGATNGADYTTLTGSVLVPLGFSSAPITIAPAEDQLVEGTETVTLSLIANAAYTLGASACSCSFSAPPASWSPPPTPIRPAITCSTM
ncbi:MAG: hypothetical protein L0215_13155, partial [Gemmataceae bacterium]|nr:hypothetical protein [Gemmataceae bacterium]